MKPKRKTDYTNREAYKYYKDSSENPVTPNQFGTIIREVNKKIMQKVFEGFIFVLPVRLGFLSITEATNEAIFNKDGSIDYRKSKLSQDFGATNKLWKEKPELKGKVRLYHENTHTEGVRYKFQWNRLGCITTHLKKYRCQIARQNRINFNNFIKEHPNTMYYE